MEEQNDGASHFQLPPMALYLLLAGSAGLGAGGMGFLGPQLQEESIRQCMDNSQTALRVAAQHGEELNELRKLIYSRTADLQSRSDARTDSENSERAATIQNRRLEALERSVDDLRKDVRREHSRSN